MLAAIVMEEIGGVNRRDASKSVWGLRRLHAVQYGFAPRYRYGDTRFIAALCARYAVRIRAAFF